MRKEKSRFVDNDMDKVEPNTRKRSYINVYI